MLTSKKMAVLALATGAALCFMGCGSKQKPAFVKNLVPATGRVTLKGKPLSGATVRFVPPISVDGGREATAIADQDGRYELATVVPGVSPKDSKGALPGEYVVSISRIAMPDGAPFPPDVRDENDAIMKGAKQSVPAVYTDAATSTLKATVAGPKAENNFEL